MNFLSTIDKLTNNPLARGVEFFWNKYKKKKITMLREVILSEIRQGDFSNVDSDDLVGISYRLQFQIFFKQVSDLFCFGWAYYQLFIN